jgi:hypothetical protein
VNRYATKPFDLAGPVRCTVAVDGYPPIIEMGCTVILYNVIAEDGFDVGGAVGDPGV